MPDLKISQLPSAVAPPSGTEVLPIVQSSTTKKIAISDLTAGRATSVLTLAATQTTNQIVLGTTNTVTISSTAPVAPRVYTLPDFGAAAIIPLATAVNTLFFTTAGATSLTLPTTGTVATLAGSEILTNKTIDGANNTITNVSLTTGITGTLPIANGGTNITNYALGDLLYSSAIDVLSRLTGNTTIVPMVMQQTGDGINSAAPVWTSSPTLAGATISGLTPSTVVVTDGSNNLASISYDTGISVDTIVQRDSDENIFSNNSITSLDSTIATFSSTPIAKSSAKFQELTGATEEIFVLPDAETLIIGWSYDFYNSSSDSLYIQDNGANQIATINPGAICNVTLKSNGDANGVWLVSFSVPSNVSFDTTGLTFPSGYSLKTETDAGNTLLLQAWDVDGGFYTTFATLTSNNVPTFDLNASTTLGGNTILTSISGYVSSLTGTANQVIASASTGAVTLSLPQSIATSSSPTFAGLILSASSGTTNIQSIYQPGTGASGGSRLFFWDGDTGNSATDGTYIGVSPSAGGFEIHNQENSAFRIYNNNTLYLTLSALGAITGPTALTVAAPAGTDTNLTMGLSTGSTAGDTSILTTYANASGAGEYAFLGVFKNIRSGSPVNSAAIDFRKNGAGADERMDFTFQLNNGTVLTERISILYDGTFTLTGNVNVTGDVSLTGLLTATGGVLGSVTGSNVTAGTLGYVVESKVAQGSAVTLTTAQYADVTSISLPAGDYELDINCGFTGGAITGTNVAAGLGTVSGNDGTGFVLGDTSLQTTILQTASADSFITISGISVRPTTTTTYYFKAIGNFTVGTLKAYGRITARVSAV